MNRTILVTVMASILFAGVVSCESVPMQQVDNHEQQTVKLEDQAAPANLELTQVNTPGTVGTIVIGSANFSVEIAANEEQWSKGLMDRESLPEKNGMWFAFPQTGLETFWMKDTHISLDLIYVSEGMQIVAIVERTTPMSETKITVDVPFKYVLEVNGGTVQKNGFKVGDKVDARIGPK